jgi:hypothetical protein
MNPVPDTQDVQAVLDRLGLVVPEADLPFLQRTLLRQREFLLRLSGAVPADTEAAHVFKVLAETVQMPSLPEARLPPIDG